MLRGYIGREWDRIQDVERTSAYDELQSTPPRESRAPELPPLDAKEYARKLLGVGPDAPFDEIRKAFERLNTRSDPGNFPAGSLEADQAAEIQKKVQWAYGVLTDHIDVTERRFRSLEIE